MRTRTPLPVISSWIAPLALSCWLVGIGLIPAAPAQADQPVGAAPVPVVSVVVLQPRDVSPQTAFTGRIEAIDKVNLRARVEGFLEQRLFREGGEVKQGELLFRIEQAPYQTAIAEIQGAIARDQGALQLAEVEQARQQQLIRTAATAQARVDEAVAKVAQARGDLMRDQAALARAQLNLGYTEIRAPFAGKIGKATYSTGALVGPGSEPLATIVRQDRMFIDFPVTQRDLLYVQRRIAAGDRDGANVRVLVRLADGTLYDQVTKVDFVDAKVDPGTDTIRVRGTIDNPRRLLVDGQLVTALVEASRPTRALVVPQQAVQLDQGGHFVLVLTPERTVQVRRVTLGDQIDAFYVVQDGVRAGEQVITEGLQKVRPGATVEPVEVPLDPVAAGANPNRKD